jgi:hypothetical protein
MKTEEFEGKQEIYVAYLQEETAKLILAMLIIIITITIIIIIVMMKF